MSSAPPARAAAVAARRISRLVHEPRGPPSSAIVAVAEAGQVLDGEPGALADVHHDGGQAGDQPVDDDQRHLAG